VRRCECQDFRSSRQMISATQDLCMLAAVCRLQGPSEKWKSLSAVLSIKAGAPVVELCNASLVALDIRKLDAGVEAAFRKISGAASGNGGSGVHTQITARLPRSCYHCRMEGHFARECRRRCGDPSCNMCGARDGQSTPALQQRPNGPPPPPPMPPAGRRVV
jgi:hypothetical protein